MNDPMMIGYLKRREDELEQTQREIDERFSRLADGQSPEEQHRLAVEWRKERMTAFTEWSNRITARRRKA